MFGHNKEERDKKKILKHLKKLKEQKDKYQQEANKAEEEMKKMAKLVLKDGKLQKPEESKPVVQDEGFPKEIMEEKKMSQAQQQYQQPVQQYQQPVQQYQQPVQQHQQPLQPPVPPYYQQSVQQPVMPSFPEPTRYIQQASALDTDIELFMINGDVISVAVPARDLPGFLNDLAEAINSQQTIQLGSQVLNGRHIVKYVLP